MGVGSWRRIASFLLLAPLLLFGSPYFLAGESDSSDIVVGSIERLGHANPTALRARDFGSVGDTLRLHAPADSRWITISECFLREALGPWGVDARFFAAGPNVVFEASDLEFRPFDVTSKPVFSEGSSRSLLLTERPMWISSIQTGHGTTIKLELDDGHPER